MSECKNIVVATSLNKADDPIVNHCKKKIIIVSGDQKNVLQRFIEAAKLHNIKSIIRVTADNPYIGFDVIALQLNNTH